jgi:peptidyl-prolyl cis-trans isomerase SurA
MMRTFSVKFLATAAAAACLISSLAMPKTAAAQVPAAPAAPTVNFLSEGVAAIVNDSIISTYDLRQRMLLLIITSGIQPTADTLGQIERESLRTLVDEALEMQELRRVEKEQKFSIIAKDDDIDRQIGRMAQENRATAQQLVASLKASGVNPETLRAQIRAEISWQRWINGRYGSRLRIGDDQVEAALARLNAAAAKPQYLMSEILIEATRVGGIDNALRGANQLIGQLQQGAPFGSVARQFSSAATSATGGDTGWVNVEELQPAVQQALEQLRPGQLSQPIPVTDGVYILLLRDKRAGSNATLVDLKQAAIRLGADATEADVEAARAKLLTLKPMITDCASVETASTKVAGVIAGDLGESEIKDLAPAFREAAEKLNVGQVSDPIRTQVGLHLIAVCAKRQEGGQVPTKDEMENRLVGQQLAMIAKRYLRDLRNSATIETR